MVRYRLIEVSLEEVLRQYGYGHLIRNGRVDHILAVKALAEICARDKTLTFDGRTLKVYRKVPVNDTE